MAKTAEEKPGFRAAQYVRMSTEHQQYSTQNQADKIKEYAEHRGMEIVRTYSDDGKSGLSIGGRASLKKLIADVEAGDVDFNVILVYDVSRWGRFQDTREIFKRNPRVLHVVDISENNMVELVRDIRSTLGYGDGDFRTFAIDCGSREFDALMTAETKYDYVLNLSALKHVRSEKDPFTLMRMIEVNILNTLSTLAAAQACRVKKYFCVSTDKAANPVNMMGASKRIMEMFLMRESLNLPISTARFANVAFSDGSLLHGFNQRLAKNQPISAPNDVRRYFVTPQESGVLCLMSTLMGDNRDIYFPKLSEALNLTKFSDIAVRYLEAHGYTPYECETEDEARSRTEELIAKRRWPVYFFASDTTGEKDFEEFFTEGETLDMDCFQSIGVILNEPKFDAAKLDTFLAGINRIRAQPTWDKPEIIKLFNNMIPGFDHKETGKYLDSRM